MHYKAEGQVHKNVFLKLECCPPLPIGHQFLKSSTMSQAWFSLSWKSSGKTFFRVLRLYWVCYVSICNQVSFLEEAVNVNFWRLVNWCQSWWEYYPNPPIEYLEMIEDLLAYHDKELYSHFFQSQITSQVRWNHGVVPGCKIRSKLLFDTVGLCLAPHEILFLWHNIRGPLVKAVGSHYCEPPFVFSIRHSIVRDHLSPSTTGDQ